MLHNFYLQIHRIKLQDYISHGIIIPDIYIGENAQRDIQSKNPDCLTLSKGYIKRLDETQLLLEITFTDKEKESFQENGLVYYYDLPIPINRIKQIYCQDKQAKENILKDIENFGSGYLPKELFVFFKKGKKILFEECFKATNTSCINFKDLKQGIAKYDKIMGMFAFMKNAHSYYFDERKTYANYSENYFDVLSKLGSNPNEKSIDFFRVLKENRDFFDLVYSDKLMSDEFIKNLIEDLQDEEIKTIFKDLIYKPNSSRECLRRLKDKDGVYFYICLVYIHKQKDSNKKENFKEDIAQEIPYEKVEYALAFLGLYYGYEDLSRSEEISISDTIIKKIIKDDEINIKFKMDSRLDCVVVENIFNHVFHKKEDIQYDCNDYPFTKKQIYKIPITDKKFKTFYEVEKKDILDIQYIQIRKRSFDEILSTRLAKYDEEIRFGKYYLASFIKKHYENIISYSKNGKPTDAYCKKKDFYDAIKGDENRKENEFFDVLDMDRK